MFKSYAGDLVVITLYLSKENNDIKAENFSFEWR